MSHRNASDSVIARRITGPAVFVTAIVSALMFLLQSHAANAQDVQYSIANEFRYGNGERYQNEEVLNTEYLEDLFNSRIYVKDFLLGFRVQVDKPREFGLGPDTIGVTQYFAEFNRDGLRARGGSFYKLVGQGLVFNSFESRPVGFNTQTNGIELDYKSKVFAGGAFGGEMVYTDIVQTSRVEEYLIRGAWGETRPIDNVLLGGSFVAATGEKTRSGFRNEFDAYLREAYGGVDYEGFSALFNWSDKRTAIPPAEQTSSIEYGKGWYGKLAYTGSLFSITGEFKDYRYDLVAPPDFANATRSTGALPFQNGPTLIPEHDKTLLARNPHTIDFNDELGFQISGLVYPSERLTFNLLATGGSRHRAWEQFVFTDTLGVEQLGHRPLDDVTLSFPELADYRYAPYWELFGQADYELNDDVYLKFALQRKENVIFYDQLSIEIPAHSEIYKVTTGMADAVVKLSQRDALHGTLELQRVFDSKTITSGNDSLGIGPSDGRFYNTLLTLEFSRSPRWAVNGRVEWSSSDQEQGGRQVWPVIGGIYRIGRTHTINAQYGWERGGVVCTGGVCRFINPFTGFRLTVTSKL